MKEKTTRYGLTLLILILLTSTVSAQEISLSGELRPRTEYLHGYKSLAAKDQEPAFWTEQRSRLNFNLKSSNYLVGMTIQDIRVWGSTPQLNKSDNFSAFHEAWAGIYFSEKLLLKLGRQELIYDDHRIFGNVGWAQQARSHDLARFQYRDSTFSFDLGLAYNQDATKLTDNFYTVNNNYKTMQYVWLHQDLDHLGVSLLFLNNGMQFSTTDTSGKIDYSTTFSQTLGSHLSYNKESLKLLGSFYYQTGKDGRDNDLNAYQIRLESDYTLTDKFSFRLGYEFLSGTSQTDTTNQENNSFAPLYGTNHKFNGFMDYFYVGNHANSVGLQDIFFGLTYKYKQLSAGADIHFFSAAEDILDAEKLNQTGEYKAMSSSLGTEADLTLKYKHSDEVMVQLGYSHMLATESMEALKGGDKNETNNWAYLMITFKPTFYKTIRD